MTVLSMLSAGKLLNELLIMKTIRSGRLHEFSGRAVGMLLLFSILWARFNTNVCPVFECIKTYTFFYIGFISRNAQ